MKLRSLLLLHHMITCIRGQWMPLSKFAVSPSDVSFNQAITYCSDQFSTTLASIHNDFEYQQALDVCDAQQHDSGCIFGLNDVATEGVFTFVDGTTFDYGTDISGGVYPWSNAYPLFTANHDCVGWNFGSSDGWTDHSCDDQGRAVCFTESELCDESKWAIANGDPGEWYWNRHSVWNGARYNNTLCDLVNNNTDYASNDQDTITMNIAARQWRDIILEYTFRFDHFRDSAASYAGIFFNVRNVMNASQVFWYHFGMQIQATNVPRLFLRNFQSDEPWVLGTDLAHNLNHYHTIQMKLDEYSNLSLQLNGDDQSFDGFDLSSELPSNYYIGSISIRNIGAATTSKSLYLINIGPTPEPTHEPTASPTMGTVDPTATPTETTIHPTAIPTESTGNPTDGPTIQTANPTSNPTNSPIIACSTNDDCPWDKARCNNGKCVTCKFAGQCERFDGLPNCDRYGSGECVTCLGRNTSYCATIGDATVDVCDESSGKCVGCLANSDCLNDAGPNCNPADNTCYECYEDSHCPDLTAIRCVDDACEPCMWDSDCPWNRPYCKNNMGDLICSKCAYDSHCSRFNALPLCGSPGKCVGCTDNSDCLDSKDGSICSLNNDGTTTCNPCIDSTECAGDMECNQGFCVTPQPTSMPIPPTAPTTSTPTAPTTSAPTQVSDTSTCNYVEIEDESDTSIPGMILPIDVCISRDLNSHADVYSAKPVCVNGVAKLEMYAGVTDCSGTSSIGYPCDFDIWDVNQCVVSSYNCDSFPCTYALVEWWEEVSQCDGDVPATDQYTNHSIRPFITDTCEDVDTMSLQYICVSNAFSMDVWMTSDCSGASPNNWPVKSTGCDLGSAEAAIVQCDQGGPTTAAPTTGAPTTATPTIPSPAPTSKLNCNYVEIEDESDTSRPGMVLPIDVCISRDLDGYTDVDSAKPVCVNGVAKLEMYAGVTDCSGTPSIGYPCDFDIWYMNQCIVSSYNCDSFPCTYALVEGWEEVSQCDGDVPATDQYVNHFIRPFITDTCEDLDTMSLEYTCVSNVLSMEVWMTSDCSGVSADTDAMYSTGCDLGSAEAAIVQCDQGGPTTAAPSDSPTTGAPTTAAPTTATPSDSPTTGAPSDSPITGAPSGETAVPTTSAPSSSPSRHPSSSPSKHPSSSPFKNPSSSPSKDPSASPSKDPSASPSKDPSASPSKDQSASPSKNPSSSPSNNPSQTATDSPIATEEPTFEAGGKAYRYDIGVAALVGLVLYVLN